MNARLSASIHDMIRAEASVHMKIVEDVEALADRPRKARFQPFHCCPSCEKPLSIAEVIERHCERCGMATEPQEVRAHHV